MIKPASPINLDITQEYEMLYPMMVSVFDELRELSKKKQDASLNPMKVKMANRILSKVKLLLVKEPTIEFLDLLDEDSLPSNSDAVMIIAQFKAAMEQFKIVNTFRSNGYSYWRTEENLKTHKKS